MFEKLKAKYPTITDPTEIFTSSCFKNNSEHRKAFYEWSQDVLQTVNRAGKATEAHWFLRLLQDKGLLQRLYTQNIDMLERQVCYSLSICFLVYVL